MNGMTVAGVLVLVTAVLLIGDYKSVGLDGPYLGFLVFGLGFIMTLNGHFRGDPVKLERAGGRRVKDASV